MDSRAIKSFRSLCGANLTQPEISCPESHDFLSTLPTEMFRSILGRVQTLELIPLRLVSNRWKVVIESICSDKKCVVILHNPNKYYLSELLKRFALNKRKDSVVFKLKYNRPFTIHFSGHFCTLLSKLFPCTEQFYILDYFTYHNEFNSMLRLWSPSLSLLSVRLHHSEDANNLKICAQINQLTNLKQLHLDSHSVSIKQLAPTLARLEHLSGWGHESLDKIASYLGASISSLGFIESRGVNLEGLTNWYRLNAQSVSNLVRFSLSVVDVEIFTFICKHFSSLQMLRIKDFGGLQLTTRIIEHLTLLTHLTNLQINFLSIDLTSLDVTKLKPLRNIRILTLMYLSIVEDEDFFNLDLSEKAFHLCRLLSIIFPNVQTLTIQHLYYPQFGHLLEPHVNLFANLRSHNFNSK